EQILSGKIDFYSLSVWHPSNLSSTVGKMPPKEDMVAWCAFIFAKQWGRKEDVDMKKLESIIARSKCGYVILRWAKQFSSITNIKRFQKEIMKYGSHLEIRRFAQEVPEANKEVLNNFALVKEIMESI